MEHPPPKTIHDDPELIEKFIAYHTSIATPLNVIRGPNNKPQIIAQLANVLGPNSTWMTCTVRDGLWTFGNGRSSAHIPHEHLCTHGILGILSY